MFKQTIKQVTKHTIKQAFNAFLTLLILTPLMLIDISRAYADSFDVYMERCEPYRETVERILVEEGVPVEYFALLLAESGCDLDNLSHRGAQGAWQLMPEIGRAHV